MTNPLAQKRAKKFNKILEKTILKYDATTDTFYNEVGIRISSDSLANTTQMYNLDTEKELYSILLGNTTSAISLGKFK